MAHIHVSDLNHSVGADLFGGSENFLTDLNDFDSMAVYGGDGTSFNPFINYAVKTLQYNIFGYVIQNVVSLGLSFSAAGGGAGGATDGGAGGATDGGAGGGTTGLI